MTSLITATLVSTWCVTPKFLAAVISPSAFVRVSKRRSATSMSGFPNSLLKNISAPYINDKSIFQMNRPTDPSLLHCLGRTRKYEKYLRHNFPEKLRHFSCERDIHVTFEPLKEEVNTSKEIGEQIITCGDIFHRLGQRLPNARQGMTGVTCREENTDAREDCLCGREWLRSACQNWSTDLRKVIPDRHPPQVFRKA